jgi:hypothetical protein
MHFRMAKRPESNGGKFIAALLALCLVGSAAGFKSVVAAEDKQPPSFKPGAEVTLGIVLDSPMDWHLNDQVPVVFSFEEDDLKGAAFVVEKTKWEFKLDKSSERLVAKIPVTLKKQAPEGTVSIPLSVACSICTDDSGSCAFSSEGFNVKVKVEAKPSDKSGNSALAKGTHLAQYRLSAPF